MAGNTGRAIVIDLDDEPIDLTVDGASIERAAELPARSARIAMGSAAATPQIIRRRATTPDEPMPCFLKPCRYGTACRKLMPGKRVCSLGFWHIVGCPSNDGLPQAYTALASKGVAQELSEQPHTPMSAQPSASSNADEHMNRQRPSKRAKLMASSSHHRRQKQEAKRAHQLSLRVGVSTPNLRERALLFAVDGGYVGPSVPAECS
jgi:hypothetical protein